MTLKDISNVCFSDLPSPTVRTPGIATGLHRNLPVELVSQNRRGAIISGSTSTGFIELYMLYLLRVTIQIPSALFTRTPHKFAHYSLAVGKHIQSLSTVKPKNCN